MDATGNTWLDAMLALVRAYPERTAWLTALVCFAGNAVGLSLFTPSTPYLVAIGGLIAASGQSLWPVWLAAAAGAFAGDAMSYALGRWYREGISAIWPISRFPDALGRTQLFFVRWGVWSLLAAKFSGGLRSFVPVAAGVAAMAGPTFAGTSVLACLIWTVILLVSGGGLARLFM